jgi:putative glutathione S-transferase
LEDGGWRFATADECPGAIPDTVNGFERLRELYHKANPDYTGRYTVPVLWDKKEGTIVNNESSEIIRMLNHAFDPLLPAEKQAIDFYPEQLRAEIDALNGWVYPTVNDGVYKSGFATSQAAYERNVVSVFDSLDRIEGILATNTFLVGDAFTEADIRLFTTLVR